MSITHVGKIGRLPRAIRDQLGQRLEDGASGADLVQWLNTLPEVSLVLATHFEGRPISEENISKWRRTGHPEWLRRQEARHRAWQLTEHAKTLQEVTRGEDLSDQFASVLAIEITRLAETLLAAEPEPEKRWQRLCEVNRELSLLRRDDCRAARKRAEQGRWQDEHRRTVRQEDKEYEAELKQEQCAPFLARLELPALAAALGGGETGRKIAATVLEIRNNLNPGSLSGLTPPKEPARLPAGQSSKCLPESTPVKPNEP